jgi:hypothetical protein
MTQTPKIKADRLKPIPAPSPIEPAKFDDVVVYGLHAMADGDASPQQQKKVLEWIINQASRAAGPGHYQPDSQRNTDFALGRAFVGQQIIGILKIPMMDFAISEQPPTPPTKKPNKTKE